MDVGIKGDRYFIVQVDLHESPVSPQEAINLLGGLLDMVDNEKAREHLEYCMNYCQLIMGSREHDN